MRLPLAAASFLVAAITATTVLAETAPPASGFLETLHRHSIVTSTVPPNGDQNPYAVIVAPVSSGKIAKDDVLVDNFNDRNNLQGLGTTIVDINPATRRTVVFATIPRDLPQCPGGVGLTTAMTMLRSGWMVVGSLPSRDGTTGTKGRGCLIVLDNQGRIASVFANDGIDGPWGNMAVVDRGESASLFVSMTGFGVEAPGQDVVSRATVVRFDLRIGHEGPPEIVRQTVVADGFGEQADADVFIVGPTGLALGARGELYVSDAVGNRIMAIADAATRMTSAGVGEEVTKDGLLKRPLALATAPNGHILAINGQNGQVVEIDAVTKRQIYAQWIDANKAQSPPGSGDLFGIAMTPAGDGFYYVEDEINMLALAH